MPRRKQEVKFNPLSALSEALLKQAREPNIHAYEPHSKQVAFHGSQKKGRLYIGGNRSGKTTGGVTEGIWYVSHSHPYRRTPEGPVRGRVVGVDFLQGISKIILPQYARWTPPSMLVNGSWEDSYDKQERTLKFADDGFIEFMSYDQDLEKFAGTSRHFIHYDEEPPKDIYTECQARLVDTNGVWWATMTPVEGMTWVYDDIYEKSNEGQNPLIDVIEVSMRDNPHLSEEAINDFLGTLDDEAKAAREHGTFVQLSGLVYPGFDEGGINTYADSFDVKSVPSGTEFWKSMDHGWRNPTAWLWHAVMPDGRVVTFDEHYASELTIDQHATEVRRKDQLYGITEQRNVGDPAIAQTSGITGTSVYTEYAIAGLPIAFGNNSVEVGVPKVQSYLRGPRPRWTITANCVNLRRELKHLRWARYQSKKLQYENNPMEKIHKKNDHAADAARYFFTFMPDLTPQIDDTDAKIQSMLNGMGRGVLATQVDTSLALEKIKRTDGDVVHWAVQQGVSDNLWDSLDQYEYEKG